MTAQIRPTFTDTRERRGIRAAGGIVRGKFPSRKNARMIHHRGMLELDAIYLFETSPLIVSYRERPFRLRYPDGAELRSYTPAFELVLRSGEAVFVEVRYWRQPLDTHASQDLMEIHGLGQVAAHLRRSATPLVLLTDQVVRVQPRLAALKSIYRHAPRGIPSAAAATAAAASLQTLLPNRIDVVTERLAPTGVDVYSLLLSGLLICALDASVTQSTTVHLSQEAGHDWFHISQEHGF